MAAPVSAREAALAGGGRATVAAAGPARRHCPGGGPWRAAATEHGGRDRAASPLPLPGGPQPPAAAPDSRRKPGSAPALAVRGAPPPGNTELDHPAWQGLRAHSFRRARLAQRGNTASRLPQGPNVVVAAPVSAREAALAGSGRATVAAAEQEEV